MIGGGNGGYEDEDEDSDGYEDVTFHTNNNSNNDKDNDVVTPVDLIDLTDYENNNCNNNEDHQEVHEERDLFVIEPSVNGDGDGAYSKDKCLSTRKYIYSDDTITTGRYQTNSNMDELQLSREIKAANSKTKKELLNKNFHQILTGSGCDYYV